jgi:hypothetical protein
MSEKRHKIVENFDFEDGSLDGVSTRQAFLLGIEWQLFREKLASEVPFTIYCLPENATRLVKMAERHKRFVEDRPNAKPGWTQIYVGDSMNQASF